MITSLKCRQKQLSLEHQRCVFVGVVWSEVFVVILRLGLPPPEPRHPWSEVNPKASRKENLGPLRQLPMEWLYSTVPYEIDRVIGDWNHVQHLKL